MISDGPIEVDPKDRDVIISIRREDHRTIIDYQPGVDPMTLFVHYDGNKAIVQRLNGRQMLWREAEAWGGFAR